jgi:hypothetical protein
MGKLILNTYLVVPHFKMETNRSIRASILPGMWSTSLDLTDAYFHCLISVAFRKYLRFVWDNKVFSVSSFPIRVSHEKGMGDSDRGGNCLN